MASNLNKAFMRAYAKDSGRPVAASAAPTPEAIRPANAAPNRQQPVEATPQPTVRSAIDRQLPGTQVAGQAPIAAAHGPIPTAAPSQVISGRYVQRAAPATSADSATAADAASVWQRIDSAQSIQPPHMANPEARPIASSVGVGTTSGPRRMHAGASSPAAPEARTADWYQPQPVDLPLLPDEPNAFPGDSQAVDTRRRTVADFLYSAGKVTASAASPARPAADNAARPIPLERPLGRPTGAQPEWAAARASTSAAVGPGSHGANTAVQSSQGRASTPAAERLYAPVASAAHAPLPVHAPVKLPEPAAVPVSTQPIQPPSKRMGQILRVDVPGQARRNDADSDRATASTRQAIDQAMLDVADNVTAPAAGIADEQRRIDRGHELSSAEQKLRRSKHKVFNPVWEVDSLQWPGVCDKLMEHRAESMAQVAAHLKAACEDGLSILGVTSPASGEGRTTVACCLARLAAAHGLNVVLVDLDLDHPTLCLQTNLEVEHDWSDCLAGDIDLEEVAVHSIDDQLTLLPLKDRSDRPELFASDVGIADMLRELSESFELVIVDACRMNSSGNVLCGLATAQVFDAAIVVVDRRNSHQERIEDAVRALQQTGVGSIGIVDNFSM